MARLDITFESRGYKAMGVSLASVAEALSNARIAGVVTIEFSPQRSGIVSNGLLIASLVMFTEPGTIVGEIKPTGSMILFAGWLMTLLPSRARLTWHGGWPHIYCPPNDDRSTEGRPMPSAPNELVLV